MNESHQKLLNESVQMNLQIHKNKQKMVRKIMKIEQKKFKKKLKKIIEEEKEKIKKKEEKKRKEMKRADKQKKSESNKSIYKPGNALSEKKNIDGGSWSSSEYDRKEFETEKAEKLDQISIEKNEEGSDEDDELYVVSKKESFSSIGKSEISEKNREIKERLKEMGDEEELKRKVKEEIEDEYIEEEDPEIYYDKEEIHRELEALKSEKKERMQSQEKQKKKKKKKKKGFKLANLKFWGSDSEKEDSELESTIDKKKKKGKKKKKKKRKKEKEKKDKKEKGKKKKKKKSKKKKKEKKSEKNEEKQESEKQSQKENKNIEDQLDDEGFGTWEDPEKDMVIVNSQLSDANAKFDDSFSEDSEEGFILFTHYITIYFTDIHDNYF